MITDRCACRLPTASPITPGVFAERDASRPRVHGGAQSGLRTDARASPELVGDPMHEGQNGR